MYLILEVDSAWKGYDHRQYYREIIARFGDLPGLEFNEDTTTGYRRWSRMQEASNWLASMAFPSPRLVAG